MERRKDSRPIRLWVGILLILAAAVIAFCVSRALEKRTYRLMYPDLIGQYAAENAIDPYLVAAVIHTESSNLPEAVSRSGAAGLMQIMPDTGAWIAEKLEIADFTTERLFEPALNIRFGCWYLRFLMDTFEGDRQLILAAYHAGQGNVARWLEDPEIATDGQLTNIPFGETEHYVEKVQRAYEKYRTLYPGAW